MGKIHKWRVAHRTSSLSQDTVDKLLANSNCIGDHAGGTRNMVWLEQDEKEKSRLRDEDDFQQL